MIRMNIYVGNVAYTATEEQLRELFEEFGEVTEVKIIIDKLSGRSRGFAFVEMISDDEGRTAITEVNGKQLEGRTLTVNEARPREDKRAPRRNFR